MSFMLGTYDLPRTTFMYLTIVLLWTVTEQLNVWDKRLMKHDIT